MTNKRFAALSVAVAMVLCGSTRADEQAATAASAAPAASSSAASSASAASDDAVIESGTVDVVHVPFPEGFGRQVAGVLGQPFQIDVPLPTEKGAYLGVGTGPIDAALRTQIDVPRGVGLIANFVEKGSPAGQAGIQQYDVLQKLDDQWLINADQLAALVRMHTPGDEITLGILRKGKPMSLKAKLVERDLPVLDGLIETPVHDVRIDVIPNAKMGILRLGPGASRMAVKADGKNVIKVAGRDGKLWLEVTNNDGKPIYQGPLDTPEDRLKIPQDLREKVGPILNELLGEPIESPTVASDSPPMTQPASGN